nr:BREX system ATP-binding domain-containing protein [Actinomadura coerulea]
MSFADDYLAGWNADGAANAASGSVVAVVGEYGTGKTHLALELMLHISGAAGQDVRHLYLDAPADTFLALYKQRFLAELTKDELRERVQEYYADLVADSLTQSKLTDHAAQRLRDREVRAEEVIEQLGLMKSAFVQMLRERLRAITENDAFATALTLFLQPEFEHAVWEWLRGHVPDQALAERGITAAIDTDTAALEAIGVVAFLYGRQSRRFVVVIDELEKVLSWQHSPATDTARAFKKLLEVFGAARAFLVLSGLPDFLEALPEDVRQRIGCIVRPSALTPAETRQYILDSQERAGHPRELAPFTEAVTDYLVTLAGGNARTIVKLCHHGYRMARTAGTDVTRAMIREAARDQFQLATRDDVRAEIARVLDLGGWPFEAQAAPKGTGVRADFWVVHGEDGGGCAVLIADSLLGPKDASALAAQVEKVKAGREDRAALLVVNGYLAETAVPVLAGAGDRPPLVHSRRRFAEDFEAAIKGVMQRLEAAGQENELKVLHRRVERQGRQQSQILREIQSLGEERDEVRRVLGDLGRTQRQDTETLAASLNELVRLTRQGESGIAKTQTSNEAVTGLNNPTINGDVHMHFHGPADDPPEPVEPSFLPGEVDALFTGALDRLEELTPHEKIITSLFDDRADRPGSWSISDVTSDFLRVVGVWVMLRDTVAGFRNAIAAWFRAGPERYEDLRNLCRSYDMVVSLLSPRAIEELTRALGPSEQDDVRRVFLELGSQVYGAARLTTRNQGREEFI